MTAHPVVLTFGLEWIHEFMVREDVHKQLAARTQPGGDVPEKAVVIAHMLEHLN